MRSEFLKLNLRDFFKGLIVTVISTLLSTIISLASGTDLFSKQTLLVLASTAVSSIAAYLLKNLFTNSQGEILTPEPIKEN